VGRISKEKNLQILSDIFKQLNTAGKDIHLILVGEGPYMQELQSELSNDKKVTFIGYLKGEDLSHSYASSDVFIFPSATDTFGKVVLEAQASGLPVIVTDQGGPKENMIQGKTGYIVPGNDVAAFVSRVLELYNDRDLLRRMRNNARGFMEKIAIESGHLKNWDYYQNLR
jgi:glycosyltransferase involved in cell wall biosynthesis